MRLNARGVVVRIGKATLLDGADLDIGPGALVGLIGPNGAGKSTLLRVLARLLAPDAGEVTLDGRALRDIGPATLARSVAYLAQNGGVYWPLSVEAVVRLGRLPHRHSWRRHDPADDAAVASAMAACGVQHLAHRRMGTLSGGEQLRVLLARTLAVDAPLLLADEPVAALDPYHQLQIMQILQRSVESGRSVVVVLHDLGLAARFCTHLTLLHRGRILASGTPQNVLTDGNIRDAYRVSMLRGESEGTTLLQPWKCLDPVTARNSSDGVPPYEPASG